MNTVTDWLATPWPWVGILITAHVLMGILFVKGVRENAHRDGWNDACKAIAEEDRNDRAIRELPLLDPEPDPEAPAHASLFTHHAP